MRALPEPYACALQALKDQSRALSPPSRLRWLTLRARPRPGLQDAQQRMARYSRECNWIIQFVLTSPDLRLSIVTLGEDRLAQELEAYDRGANLLPLRVASHSVDRTRPMGGTLDAAS